MTVDSWTEKIIGRLYMIDSIADDPALRFRHFSRDPFVNETLHLPIKFAIPFLRVLQKAHRTHWDVLCLLHLNLLAAFSTTYKMVKLLNIKA